MNARHKQNEIGEKTIGVFNTDVEHPKTLSGANDLPNNLILDIAY